MAKAVGFIFTLCILVAAVHGHFDEAFKPKGVNEAFNVEGDVYCDPCRVEFVTDLSRKLSGVTVRLECRNLDTKAVTYSVEGSTGADGHYSLQVLGDHENDKCEVSVTKSPCKDCNVPMEDFTRSRVVCTDNDGISAAVRYANPIGFMTRAVDPLCGPLLFNMGIIPQ